MGRFIQKILQGRGKQKGDGNRIRRLLIPLPLLISYAGIILGLPLRWALPWFLFILIISAVYSFQYLVRKIKGISLITFLSYGILISGIIHFSGLTVLHIIYIPYIFLLSLLFKPGIAIPLSISIPLLELRHLINGNRMEESLLSLTAILIGSVLSTSLSSLRSQRDEYKRILEVIREDARSACHEHSLLNEESLLSQHLSTREETDREIKNLLYILKRSLAVEAVAFISLTQGNPKMRCSVPEKIMIDSDFEGLIRGSVERGSVPVISGSASLMVSPVKDGHSVIGAIIADSGERRFNSSDVETVKLFSEQISMIIKRERINRVIKRDQLGLRLLNDGSSKLNSSLEMKTLSSSMIEAMYKVAPLKILFFIPEDLPGRPVRFRLLHYLGIVEPEDRVFDLKNTLVGNYRESQEPVYLSDLRDNNVPVLPFKIGDIGSLLILPLLYEKEPLGFLLFVSERINAISSYQINLLKILGNQASTAFANARLYAKIERMAITDGLTGLYNHRHFQERLSSEFSRLNRRITNLSLLLIDIDHFKKINDTYGHPAGDDVLRGVAGIIRDKIRNIDVPARYGGEEFAVLLPDTDMSGAIKMAERLRSSIQNQRFSFDGKEVAVTVSIGIATSPVHAKTKEELIGKADEALYEAKKGGRNRYICWGQV